MSRVQGLPLPPCSVSVAFARFCTVPIAMVSAPGHPVARTSQPPQEGVLFTCPTRPSCRWETGLLRASAREAASPGPRVSDRERPRAGPERQPQLWRRSRGAGPKPGGWRLLPGALIWSLPHACPQHLGCLLMGAPQKPQLPCRNRAARHVVGRQLLRKTRPAARTQVPDGGPGLQRGQPDGARPLGVDAGASAGRG